MTKRGRVPKRAENSIIRRVKIAFPKGASIQLNAAGAKAWPRSANRFATIVGHSHGGCPIIRFDGNKTATSWHEDYLKIVKRS